MKKRIISFALAICVLMSCAFALTSCDFGGDETDPTLYHLTLKTSSNVTLGAEQQAELRAEAVYPTRDPDEAALLLDAGATQADLDKAGVRQDDGSYYFFDADPIYLYAPEVEGYRFVGFFVDGQDIGYKPLDTHPKDGKPDAWWNMLQEDTVVEARYEYLNYQITYVDRNGVIENPTNPTAYNGKTDGTVTLNDPAEIPGYAFKYWYYVEILFDDTDRPETRMVKCTQLPTVGNEGIIHSTVNAAGESIYELTLFAEYEDAEYTVTLNYDADIVPLHVENGVTGENITPGEAPIKVKYGTSLFIRADIGDMDPAYELVGIYVNGTKIPDIDMGDNIFVPSNATTQTITTDTVIEIRIAPVSE